jgi:hypothetical protein
MKASPDSIDDISWVPQARILELCDISRTTLNSWIKSGLDIPEAAAAYKVSDLVKLLVFAGARKHLTPQQMASAWRELVKTGEAAAITNAARGLKDDDSFDLVIDVKYRALTVVRSDEELVSAVRHPSAPRPVVVVDLAERMRDGIGSFFRDANQEAPPVERKRGRPKRVQPNFQVVTEEKG